MTVDELNNEELEQLREAYFDQLQETTGDEVLQGITDPKEIPMELIKEHYEAFDFVKEDFWCNI